MQSPIICKVVRITTKKAAYIGLMFENTWLSCFPRLMHVFLTKEESSQELDSNKCCISMGLIHIPPQPRIHKLMLSMRGYIRPLLMQSEHFLILIHHETLMRQL